MTNARFFDELSPLLQRLESDPGTPEDIRALIAEWKIAGEPFLGWFLNSTTGDDVGRLAEEIDRMMVETSDAVVSAWRRYESDPSDAARAELLDRIRAGIESRRRLSQKL